MLLASAGAAAQEEFPQQLLLGLEPGVSRPALVTLPPGWVSGDAVVLILASQPQHALREALLADHAAVAELIVREADRDTAPWLREVSRAARRDLGAGLQVAIGVGRGAHSALRAAAAGDAPLTAALVLGDGFVDAAPGPPPPVEEAWTQRAPMLCALVTSVAGGTAMAGCLAGLRTPSARR
jgi:hypothetical protein